MSEDQVAYQPRRQTLGEYRVGLDPNADGRGDVTLLQEKAAAFIDELNRQIPEPVDFEVMRLAEQSIFHAEMACDLAVKAATKPAKR